jgi:hypothetical protein
MHQRLQLVLSKKLVALQQRNNELLANRRQVGNHVPSLPTHGEKQSAVVRRKQKPKPKPSRFCKDSESEILRVFFHLCAETLSDSEKLTADIRKIKVLSLS